MSASAATSSRPDFFGALSSGNLLLLPMAATVLTVGAHVIVPSLVPRFALAIGAWIAAIALRVGPFLGPRRWQFIALSCALASPVLVWFAREDLDVTIAEQWRYVHGGDGGLLARFVFRLLVTPVVSLVATAIAFRAVSGAERRWLDRAWRVVAPIATAAAAAALVFVVVRARSLPGPLSRRIETSDLELGIIPSAWVPVAERRWEIAGDESTLVLAQGAGQTAATGLSVSASVRRRDGTLVMLNPSLGPRVEIRRDDRSDVWVVTGDLNHDQPPRGHEYIAQHGHQREKLTVVDLAASTGAPKPTLVLAAIGISVATLLLVVGAAWRRRARSVRWRSARIGSDGRLALDDGTELVLGDCSLGEALPGTPLLVTLRPETEPPVAYRRVPIIDRVRVGSLEERDRALRGNATALASGALALVLVSSAGLVAAFTLGLGIS